MAEKLPQFENTQPILNVQEVASKADSYNAFAKSLGKIANTAENAIETRNEQQSNASFLQSSGDAENIKTNANIEMIKNPDQAAKITEQTSQTLAALNQSAFVNKSDRAKLTSITRSTINSLRLKSAELEHKENVKKLGITFWDTYPTSNQQIQDSLDSGDFKQAETLETSLHEAARSAAEIGAITPTQYARIQKASGLLYSRTHSLMDMAKNPEGHTAEDFHAAHASPFNNDTTDNVNFPVNSSTQWTADHYNNDRTMGGQLAAIYNDTKINYGVVAQSTPHEFEEFKLQWSGANQVKAAIHSATPLNEIENKLNNLASQPKLTAEQTGALNYWKSFKNQLQQQDGYLRMMSKTTLGGQYTHEFNDKEIAINSTVTSPADRQAQLRDNYNDYIGKMKSLGQSQHLDPSMIKPIPSNTVIPVQAAFQKDSDVLPAIERIAYLHPENRAYLAESMKKPNQAMAVWIAGNTLDKTDTSFQADIMQANQEGKDFSSLMTSGKSDAETSKANVWADIINADPGMKDLYSYLGKMPHPDVAQQGLRESAINYVYDQAQRHGDIALANKDKYVADFVKNTLKGNEFYRTERAFLNLNDLGINRSQDADYISDYALSNAYKALHAGRTEAEFQAYIDLNPMMVTSTPDKRLVVMDRFGRAAVDKDGHPAFDVPYTSNMLAAAHKNAETTQEEMHKYFGITENMQREARLHPGFPFAMHEQDQLNANKSLAELMSPAPAKDMKINNEGYDFIKQREGTNGKPSLSAYKDAAGVWTIGYGHTEGVKPGMKISTDEAEQFLLKDTKSKEAAVKKAVKVPLNTNQYHALVSFAFNTGAGAIATSTLVKKINSGASADEIKAEFRKWNKVTKDGRLVTEQGLVNRREHEIKLYFKKAK